MTRPMRIPTRWIPLLLFFAVACAGPGHAPLTAPSAADTDKFLRQAAQALDKGQLKAAQARYTRLAEAETVAARVRAVAWANLGVIHARTGRLPEAVSSLEQAVALAPDMALAHFNLGVVQRRMGRMEAARDSYLKAEKLDPDNMDIPYNLGILYELYLNQPDRAKSAYSRYVDGGGDRAAPVSEWMQAIRLREKAQ